MLVQDGVDGNGRLAGLPVAQNQLALAAPDGNECIDDLQAGLQRHDNRRTIHDGRCRTFNRRACAGKHRPQAVERAAQRVNHPAQQAVAHDNVHHPPGALDLVARMQARIVAQQHHADFSLVHIEGNAKHIAGKLHQFVITHAGQAGHHGDGGRNAGDRADFLRRQLRLKRVAALTQTGKGGVQDGFQGVKGRAHAAFSGAAGWSFGWDCSLMRSQMRCSSEARKSAIFQATFHPLAESSMPLIRSGVVSN